MAFSSKAASSACERRALPRARPIPVTAARRRPLSTPLRFKEARVPDAPPVVEPLNLETINWRVVHSEYAVRGELVTMAQKMARELKEGTGSYPFDKVVWCNIGNPQQLGQRPLTYFRQVLALCELPSMLDDPEMVRRFPRDVVLTAQRLLADIPGGLGAYSESAGVLAVRRMVAEGILRRDGVACDPADLVMTNGASPAVHYLMELLLREDADVTDAVALDRDAMMVPIPQYPLYSATLTLYGGHLVPYHLDERKHWGLDVEQLRKQLDLARDEGLCVRSLVVINPGNPTGQCLSYANQQDVLSFCHREGLVLIADEVYQTNIYNRDHSFTSFRKVASDMGLLGQLPLASLHSISKGFIGECGRRGGFVELTGFPEQVKAQMIKLASINLCPNVSGQVCAALMMNPPRPGDPSFKLYDKERGAVLGSLERRAKLLVEALNRMEGVSCNPAEGALYAFPRITLPQAAVEAAKCIGKQPDWLYCRELLEATGIVVVPGSGFGQEDGTFHFRTTFLPSEHDMQHVVDALASFHAAFMRKYQGEAQACSLEGRAEADAAAAAAVRERRDWRHGMRL